MPTASSPSPSARRTTTERERRRTALGALPHPARSLPSRDRPLLLGSLVRDGGHLDSFRTLFGDERADYAAALDRNYQQGRRRTGRTITSVPTPPPTLEDFAETFAHYLHMVDALDTASALGLRLTPQRSAAIGSLDLPAPSRPITRRTSQCSPPCGRRSLSRSTNSTGHSASATSIPSC